MLKRITCISIVLGLMLGATPAKADITDLSSVSKVFSSVINVGRFLPNTLENYMNRKLDENQEFKPYEEETIQNNNKFKLLTSSLSMNDFGYNDVSSYIEQKNKLKKMQTLAEHIANNYAVELTDAEQIVLTSYTESQKHAVEPLLLLSIIGVESTYKRTAKSNAGAIGLSQIVPVYHKEKIKALKEDNLDLWSIKGNIRVGAQVLREYINLANGNIQSALQMYNGSSKDMSKSYSRKVFSKMNSLTTVAKI